MATTWFVLGSVQGEGAETAEGIQNQLVGLGGLGALAAGAAVESHCDLLIEASRKKSLIPKFSEK